MEEEWSFWCTSDSHVNSYFPYRWSLDSLTFNIYLYPFPYLYITRITINNDTSHLKSPKNQNRRAALGRPAIKLQGGGGGGLEPVCGRPTIALCSALVHQKKTATSSKTLGMKRKQKAKRAAGIEGQVATMMLESHTRQIDTLDTTTTKRARKKKVRKSFAPGVIHPRTR